MKQGLFRTLAAAAAIAAVSGFATLAQAGLPLPPSPNIAPVPFGGSTLSVSEIIVPMEDFFVQEFTINNPASNPFGGVFGMMVAIPDLGLEAITGNEFWEAETIGDTETLDDILGFLVEIGGDLAILDLFGDFEFGGGDSILAFRTLEPGAMVAPGTSRGGFFGFATLLLASDVVLFGVDLTNQDAPVSFCTGGTNEPCTSNAVPEPGALALFGIGAIGIAVAVRRRRRPAA